MKVFERIDNPNWNEPINYELPEEIIDLICKMSDDEKELNSIWISELLSIYPRKRYPAA